MAAPAAIDREFGRFVGSAPVMHRLYREIELCAASDERVLILGETGTGKMLAALEIRDRSPRRDGPFVVLNCAGFDHSLMERELFGHVKVAFTGAIESKKGLFEATDGGKRSLPSPASTWTARRRVSTAACAAAGSSSVRIQSLTPAPAGPASGMPSMPTTCAFPRI